MRFIFFALSLLLSFSARANCKDCTQADFGKMISFSELEKVLPLNRTEKIKYFEKLGIDVFKITPPSDKTIDELPEADPQKFSKFLSYFDDNDVHGGAVGLYMTENNLNYPVTKPTILFQAGADDWALVHEFTHYLFDRARLANGEVRESLLLNNMSDAKKDFDESLEGYRSNQGYFSDRHKSNLVESFISYAKIQMQFILSAEMEEMAIEHLLRKEYEKKSPVGFTKEHFARSTRYINSTATGALVNLNILKAQCKDVRATLLANDALLEKLDATCVAARDLKAAIKTFGANLNMTFKEN